MLEYVTAEVCLRPSQYISFMFVVGAEEGKRYIDKTVTKHNEIVESIKELCNGLMDLEDKLQVGAPPIGHTHTHTTYSQSANYTMTIEGVNLFSRACIEPPLTCCFYLFWGNPSLN